MTSFAGKVVAIVGPGGERVRAVAVAFAEAGVVETLHRVIDVEAVLRARRRLDGPVNEREAERLRDGLGKERLSGAGLALHEERALERERAVDGGLDGVVGEVARGPGEAAEVFHGDPTIPARSGGAFDSRGAATAHNPVPPGWARGAARDMVEAC